MVDHEHLTDAPDTDQIPVQAANPTPAPTPGRHQAPAEPMPVVPTVITKQVKRTRISGLWVGVTLAAVVLLVLLVFIIQNGQSVRISFFGAGLQLPLGVALLLAAICGVLLVAIPGYARIIQLRRAVRRARQA
ncbi:MAG TPA: lipopolysaccharide assembly protein LapA domain-containing protein [Pseudonocardiaceae bacterium]|nr:lipopolysaccharide assembly protein LapA domain-containing protein [Pseudonocardiaceae bacterium]